MSEHLIIATALVILTFAAASDGRLKTDRVKNASGALFALSIVMLLLGAISHIDQNGYTMIWLTWGGLSALIGAFSYLAAFWFHSRFEISVKRHRAK